MLFKDILTFANVTVPNHLDAGPAMLARDPTRDDGAVHSRLFRDAAILALVTRIVGWTLAAVLPLQIIVVALPTILAQAPRALLAREREVTGAATCCFVASTVVVTVVDATSLVAFLAYETFVAYAFTFHFFHTISAVLYRHSSAYTVNTTIACF